MLSNRIGVYKKKHFSVRYLTKLEGGVCVCVCRSYLWSRVFRLCCAVSHLAVFHIEGSFGTLLHTKQTAISQAVSKISWKRNKQTNKKKTHQKGPHQSNTRLSQQTQASPLSATLENMLSLLRLLLRKANKNVASLNNTNKTQLTSLHLAASPGNSRGHKTGLNCSKTLAAKYWSRNSPQSAPVEKNS